MWPLGSRERPTVTQSRGFKPTPTSKIQVAEQFRKLPRQVDTAKGDCTGGFSLGKNVRGGTRPRLSCGRSWL